MLTKKLYSSNTLKDTNGCNITIDYFITEGNDLSYCLGNIEKPEIVPIRKQSIMMAKEAGYTPVPDPG